MKTCSPECPSGEDRKGLCANSSTRSRERTSHGLAQAEAKVATGGLQSFRVDPRESGPSWDPEPHARTGVQHQGEEPEPAWQWMDHGFPRLGPGSCPELQRSPVSFHKGTAQFLTSNKLEHGTFLSLLSGWGVDRANLVVTGQEAGPAQIVQGGSRVGGRCHPDWLCKLRWAGGHTAGNPDRTLYSSRCEDHGCP